MYIKLDKNNDHTGIMEVVDESIYIWNKKKKKWMSSSIDFELLTILM